MMSLIQEYKKNKNSIKQIPNIDYSCFYKQNTLLQSEINNNQICIIKKSMGKKQANKSAEKVKETVRPIEVEVEEAKQQIAEKAKKEMAKFLPHEKYILRKTKLITKKKNEAIEFIKMDKFQVAKAVQCLKEFDKNNSSTVNLFSGDAFIYLQFDLSKVPEHYTIRPVQIQLPHPIYAQKYNSRFTIFSCDPENEFTDKIQDLKIPQIAEVIGYEKVKKNYKQNIDKLKLISANEVFFCDWKIYNLLRQPLGKVFYDKKKYPFPIDCENVPEDLQSKFSTYEEYINDLANYTYFMMGNGPVYTVKIGRISMDSAELVKNIMRGIYRTIPHILGNQLSPSDIRQITLKTFNSPSLPIYNFLDQKYVSSFKSQQQKVKVQVPAKAQKKVAPAPKQVVTPPSLNKQAVQQKIQVITASKQEIKSVVVNKQQKPVAPANKQQTKSDKKQQKKANKQK